VAPPGISTTTRFNFRTRGFPVHVFVTDRRGEIQRLEALEGFRLMEVIRDWDMDIKAECGGACACATCHVHVAPEWLDRLQPPREDEIERLDDAFDVNAFSRLSCQILMTEALSGLHVTLAPGTERDRVAA
jgi:ferredoxin, 2Fe-2S